MAPHTLTLVSSGVAVDVLNLARVEVESLFVDGRYEGIIASSLSYLSKIFLSLSLSIATLDDTADEIQWGPAWVSALGGSTFYNSTIQYAYAVQPEGLPRLISVQLHGTTRRQDEPFVRGQRPCDLRNFRSRDGILCGHIGWAVRHLERRG